VGAWRRAMKFVQAKSARKLARLGIKSSLVDMEAFIHAKAAGLFGYTHTSSRSASRTTPMTAAVLTGSRRCQRQQVAWVLAAVNLTEWGQYESHYDTFW